MSLPIRAQPAIAVLGSILLACPLYGCGSSNTSTAKPRPPAGAASSSVPASGAVGIAKSRALAYAREVNLRASDVPQMTARGAEREKTQIGPAAFELSSCSGTTSPTARVADVHSPRFIATASSGRESVRSDVEVKPSAALAARDAAAFRSGRAQDCIKRLLQHALTSETPLSTVRIQRQLSVQPLPSPLHAGSSSFGMRILLTVSAARPARHVTVRSYFDVLGFAAGPAEITLTARRSRKPPSTQAEQRLVSLLHDRATARTLA